MRNKPYVLTPRARQSFRAAKAWSKGRWGDDLTRKYFEDLDKAACYVAEKHQLLLGNVELTANKELGIYPAREHYLVFVPISKERIAIVDLIRQGRDIPSILARNATIIRHELDAIASKEKNKIKQRLFKA